MPLIYLFNDTASPKIMGGKLVPPGEGREVDDVHMPAGEVVPEQGATVAPEGGDGGEPSDEQLLANLREVLKQPLSKIIPTLADHSDETLVQLAKLEGDDETPRKTLLGAIAELQLSRAQAKTGAPT